MGELRDARGRFRPGASGNRGGRPRGLAATVRETADLDTLIGTLLAIVTDTGARSADRIRACELLLDRGWGKAASFQPIVDGDPLEKSDLDDAIVSIIEQLRASSRNAEVN